MISLSLLLYIYENLYCLSNQFNQSQGYPRTVWMYYDGILTPSIQQMFFTTLKTLSKSWTVHFLQPNNISMFIPEADLPCGYYGLNQVHKSDFLRIYLVARYGGWWIDFNTLISDTDLLDQYYERARATSTDFLTASWTPKVKTDMVTCFFYAPIGSRAAEMWLQEVYTAFEMGRKNYIINTYRNGISFRHDIFHPYPHIWDYMCITVAWDRVVLRVLDRRERIIVLWNGESFDKLYIKVNQDMKQFKQLFLQELNNHTFQMIKLRRYQREYIWPEHSEKIRNSFERHPLVEGLSITPAPTVAERAWRFLLVIELLVLTVTTMRFSQPAATVYRL